MSTTELIAWTLVFVMAAGYGLTRRRPMDSGQVPPRPMPPSTPPAVATPPDDDEIRFVGELSKVKVEPGDVFVLSTERMLTQKQAEVVEEWWSQRMDGAKVLILHGGFKLGVAQMPKGSR